MNHTDLIKQLRDALYFRQPCTHKRVTRPTEENNWLSECRDCGAKNHLTLTFGHDRERAREIAELIAEADAHLKSGGWVPMKSVPKNVTVLLCVPTRCNKRQRYVIAQGEWFGSYWAIPNADEAIQQVTPVAWQPLPQPPEQTMNTVVQEHWNGDEDMARGHAAITAEMSTEVDAYLASGDKHLKTPPTKEPNWRQCGCWTGIPSPNEDMSMCRGCKRPISQHK